VVLFDHVVEVFVRPHREICWQYVFFLKLCHRFM
jgi:hypothetical protein